MVSVNDEECKAAGIDPQKIERLGGRIERAARELSKMGVTIFGGSGSGSLRYSDKYRDERGALILCQLYGGDWDGGDGGCGPNKHDDFERGEF